MCQTIHFHSRCCGHHWLQISRPCWPGQGFRTCPTFADGCARDPAPELGVDGLCPACSCPCSCPWMAVPAAATAAAAAYYYNQYPYYGSHGQGCYSYDTHYVRMITDIRDRLRWGEGPFRSDPGLECAVM